MPNQSILIVDDELSFLLSLKDGLAAHKPDLKILTAGDGQDAIQVMDDHHIDLLVTDLKLPIMDGFQLLAHVTRKYPDLPVIVMTAFGTPEIESRLAKISRLHYLEKPLDFDQLANTIEETLSDAKRSIIRGITLATFLQLVHLEQKNCTLKVRSAGKTGYLFIDRGSLIDAETGTLAGEAAATEIVAWDNTEIEMDNVCRRKSRVIESSMEFLVMEAFRLKDEAAAINQPVESEPQQGQKSQPKPRPDQEHSAYANRLPERLNRSLLVEEFAIFDRLNFLIHQSSKPCSLSAVDPSWHQDITPEIAENFGFGRQNYALVQIGSARRVLFVSHHEYTAVLALRQGVKIRQVLAELGS
ncbi:MAG: hypothetical protein C0616_11745 [Desulfuromonas sp.]|nr:MAG: hypothetical protein C0616_11745 [Desulfuromonas sp.]